MKNFRIKKLSDGRAMLNLACGTVMNWDWNNIDFSPYAKLVKFKKLTKIFNSVGILSKKRYERLANVSPDIISWDLRKGIPFNDKKFDVVYCSHFLEHIYRDSVSLIIRECQRVIKIGGLIRVVVPDLKSIIKLYTIFTSKSGIEKNFDFNEYNEILESLFGQMVREEPVGTSEQSRFVRRVESYIRGNAAKVGELHKWMYDQYSLAYLFRKEGFGDCEVFTPVTSRIKGWVEFNLDTTEDGLERHPDSIYFECIKK